MCVSSKGFLVFTGLIPFFFFFFTLPGEHERDVGNLCSTARESRRQNIQQRSPVLNLKFDQNSMAEKTRRAKERSDEEETGDLNGAPL